MGVTAQQLINWDLRQTVHVRSNLVLQPIVQWFDVSEFEKYGYKSRFGDGRDRYVDQPAFHSLTDLVAVQWRAHPTAGKGGEESRLDNCLQDVTEEEILERKQFLELVG